MIPTDVLQALLLMVRMVYFMYLLRYYYQFYKNIAKSRAIWFVIVFSRSKFKFKVY